MSPRKRLGPSQSEKTEEIHFPTSPSMTITSSAWLQHFNKEKSIKALESLTTLLATQTLIYLNDRNEPRKNRQYICREMNIHSELSVFHEYVKNVSRTFTSSRCFEDYIGIVRTKYGSTPIKSMEETMPRDLDLKTYIHEGEVNQFTLEAVTKDEIEFREKLAGCYVQKIGRFPVVSDDGEPLNVLTKVNFKFPDYFILLSNLFASICKSEDV